MSAQIFNEAVSAIDVHGNNDLFSRRSLGCHVDLRFWFFSTADDFLDINPASPHRIILKIGTKLGYSIWFSV